MNTFKNIVACSPFPAQHMEKVIKGGFAMVDKKVQLQELAVVFQSADPDVEPGDKVWVRGDAVTQPWAKEVFTVDGREFILVPAQYLLLVKASTQDVLPRPLPTGVPP